MTQPHTFKEVIGFKVISCHDQVSKARRIERNAHAFADKISSAEEGAEITPLESTYRRSRPTMGDTWQRKLCAQENSEIHLIPHGECEPF